MFVSGLILGNDVPYLIGNIMSNIKNYYFNNLDIFLTNRNYWDLFLCYDNRLFDSSTLYCNSIISGASLVSYFDFNNPNCISGNTIFSLTCWTGSTLPISGLSLCDIGLTGVDNGFVNNLSGETLNISSGDCRLFLTRVSGHTYDYRWSILSGSVGNYIGLCGGFFQGFWKLQGFDYQVIPKRNEWGWTAEFWLKKGLNCVLSSITSTTFVTGATSGDSGTTGVSITVTAVTIYTSTTLNDVYPNNKGFFFFLGARSENKFWNLFSGESGYTTCESGYTITPTPTIYDPLKNENPFLIWNGNNCGCYKCQNSDSPPQTGSTCCINPYDIFNTCGDPCGGSACNGSCGGTCGGANNCDDISTINGFKVSNIEHECYSCSATTIYNKDPESDIVDNNIGFRIKDDGSIGYRLITFSSTCSGQTTITAITINEEYSLSGMVKDDVWTHVVVLFKRDATLPCITNEKYPPFPDFRKGKLMFFVNGYLKLIVHNFNEVLFRDMNDLKYKVEGVAYNISIGGGTQGLIESQTFNGPDLEDKNLLMEQHFAGTFIGGIQKFRLYDFPLDVTQIRCNYKAEKDIYK